MILFYYLDYLNITYTELNIKQAILAVLSNQKTLNFDYIVHEVIINNFDEENKIIKNFEKFNILDDFWELINMKFSYNEEVPNVSRLVRFLILNYTASLYHGPTPKSWEEYFVSSKVATGGKCLYLTKLPLSCSLGLWW